MEWPRPAERPALASPRHLPSWLVKLAVAGLIAVLTSPGAIRAQSAPREWYVSPSGLPSNDGSAARPLSLAAALGGSSPARPGDTIWLRGGTYVGNFTSSLTGTPSAPIMVKQYPGERATLDGVPDSSLAILTVGGADTWFWDFEVTNSDPQRLLVPHNVGMNMFGPRTKAINIISHDNGGGFGLWSSAVDAEIYGSIIYNVGWEGSSQGAGHSIYTQNATGTRRLSENILFNGFSFGIHAYTEGGAINNMVWEGNVAFNHGVLSAKSGAKANFLLGGGQVAHDAVIVNNYLYQSPGVGGRHLDIGYGTSCVNPSIRGNYVAGSGAPILLNCSTSTVTGNTFIGSVSSAIRSAHPGNTYLTVPPSSTFTAVRPNRYEAGRGHVIVYNWGQLPEVSVDVSAVGLRVGDVFEVRDPQNYFANPLLVGVYNGAPITFPMTGLSVAPPVGNAPVQPTHTGPEFAVFIVKRVAGDLSRMPPSARLGVSPALVATGQGATLSWSSALAASVSIDQGIGPVAASGTLAVQPATTTTYTLTATNAFGTVTSSATLGVAAPGTATFLRTDSATQGMWKGMYGADGHSIAAETPSLPAYAHATRTGDSQWVWIDSTSDIRALQKVAGGGSRASTWYASPRFSIDVALTDGRSHTVALYMVDWDRYGRSQTVDVIDGVTNRVLDSRTVSSLADGKYLVWEVSERVRFRITGQAGPNAVVSGIFFDTPGASGPPPLQPTASLSASALIIAPGGSSTLSWATANATAVSFDQGIGAVAATGSHVVAPLTTTTYTLAAQNAASTVTRQVTVVVTPTPTASLSGPASVTAGQSATLSWSTSNATSVSIDQGIGPVASSGTRSVTPSTTTTYTVTASNAVGSASSTSTITVVPASPPTLPPAPTGLAGAARFLRADPVTQGSWRGALGAEGYAFSSESSAVPSYAQLGFTGQSSWVWSANTTDPRALQKPTGSGRIAATWYASSSFFIDLAVSDGRSHTVTMHMLDWDSPYRSQTIDVIDASTNAVLDSRSASGFQNGLYLAWEVSGRVRFRVTRTGASNAVISGIFFDAGPGAAPGGAATRFLQADSATQGSWKGMYGTEGYALAAVGAGVPGYARVMFSGKADWTWNPGTTDVRALQFPSGTGRLAATWYSGGGFLIDVAIDDGQSHPVALYMVDWDSTSRAQTVDLIDATTNTVLDSRSVSGFRNGIYLVWQVSGHVRFRVTRTGGANAVVSGVLFGRP